MQKTLLYAETPQYYTWNPTRKEWKRRVQGTSIENWPGVKSGDALGRVYTVHVSNFECFCLRMLLNKVRGPTSFNDLKTVNGQEYSTFREACEVLGLMEHDNHWDDTMEEAVLCRSPAKLRELFAIMISTCGLSNPLQMWNKYKTALTEDIAHMFQEVDELIEGRIHNEGLKIIEDQVSSIAGRKLSDFGLPMPQRDEQLCNDVIRELNYDRVDLETQVRESLSKLLPDQREIFTKIVQKVETEEGGIYFIDAPGGTGKTFLLNLILAQVRKDGNIAIAVASSGIAAT